MREGLAPDERGVGTREGGLAPREGGAPDRTLHCSLPRGYFDFDSLLIINQCCVLLNKYMFSPFIFRLLLFHLQVSSTCRIHSHTSMMYPE